MSGIESSSKSYQDDMEFGNRMAVLSGDFLLANACTGLAELKNTEVVCMISEVIGHLMEGEFLKMTFGGQNLNLDFWNELVFKCKGSLMANSCKAALKIVSHSTEVRVTLTRSSKPPIQALVFHSNDCFWYQKLKNSLPGTFSALQCVSMNFLEFTIFPLRFFSSKAIL